MVNNIQNNGGGNFAELLVKASQADNPEEYLKWIKELAQSNPEGFSKGDLTKITNLVEEMKKNNNIDATGGVAFSSPDKDRDIIYGQVVESLKELQRENKGNAEYNTKLKEYITDQNKTLGINGPFEPNSPYIEDQLTDILIEAANSENPEAHLKSALQQEQENNSGKYSPEKLAELEEIILYMEQDNINPDGENLSPSAESDRNIAKQEIISSLENAVSDDKILREGNLEMMEVVENLKEAIADKGLEEEFEQNHPVEARKGRSH